MISLRKLDRQQQISWGIALAIAAILMLILFSPLWANYAKYRDAAEINASTLTSLKYLKDSRASLEASYLEYQNTGLRDWLYASTDSEDQISLAIQKQVTEQISASGASLVSASVLKSKPSQEYLEPGVRLDFQGELNAVLQVLQQLETARPVLVIDNLLIRPQNDRRRGGQVTVQLLSVQLEVRAYIPVAGAKL